MNSIQELQFSICTFQWCSGVFYDQVFCIQQTVLNSHSLGMNQLANFLAVLHYSFTNSSVSPRWFDSVVEKSPRTYRQNFVNQNQPTRFQEFPRCFAVNCFKTLKWLPTIHRRSIRQFWTTVEVPIPVWPIHTGTGLAEFYKFASVSPF